MQVDPNRMMTVLNTKENMAAGRGGQGYKGYGVRGVSPKAQKEPQKGPNMFFLRPRLKFRTGPKGKNPDRRQSLPGMTVGALGWQGSLGMAFRYGIWVWH